MGDLAIVHGRQGHLEESKGYADGAFVFTNVQATKFSKNSGRRHTRCPVLTVRIGLLEGLLAEPEGSPIRRPDPDPARAAPTVQRARRDASKPRWGTV